MGLRRAEENKRVWTLTSPHPGKRPRLRHTSFQLNLQQSSLFITSMKG